MQSHVSSLLLKVQSLCLSFLVIGSAIIYTSCVRHSRYRNCSGCVWSTEYHIKYKSDKNLDDSIQVIFKEVENSLSPFSKNSLISRINSGTENKVDSLFRRVFSESQYICSISDGMFDPTVSPLINLWGFGYRNSDHTPSPEEIEAALETVGIEKCYIRNDSIIKISPKTEFNFSAITKGYGCDLIGEMLRRNGSTDFLVEIGGEIKVSGHNPYNEEWTIMIDAPVESNSDAIHAKTALINITDCGIATSGNYRNYKENEMGRIGHTINPKTGYPAIKSPILSASVIAENTMIADALATACMAMSPDSAMTMIRKFSNAEVLLVLPDSTDIWKIITSPNFPTYR